MQELKWTLTLCLLLHSPIYIHADERYFVTIFAGQTVPFEPRKTHTFVVVHRVGPEGVLEQSHISWFPQSRTLRGLTLLPEPGINLTIEETFAHCRKYNMLVAVWGPYEIKPELYFYIDCRRKNLDSGSIKYKPTETFYPSSVAVNCYHAIWQPIAPCRKLSGAFNCGHASGATTVALFSQWIIHPKITYDRLLEIMIPPGQPLIRRSFEDRPSRRDALLSFLSK